MSNASNTNKVNIPERGANRDPISGAPGAHPLGAGIGAALGGAAAGAAAGTVVGPVGTVVGLAVGAIVGGLAGKGVAESIDPTLEDSPNRFGMLEEIVPAIEIGVGFLE